MSSGQEVAEAQSEMAFAFKIPEGCPVNTVLKVKAPDGLQLSIPLPANVLGGDEMHMVKRDGRWGVQHVVRCAVDDPEPEQTRTEEQLDAELNDVNTCLVELVTSKGPLRIRVCPSWAPFGAQRFLQLVADGYYRDVAIYRAVPNFLIQFGIVKDTSRSERYEALQDDLLRGVPFLEGMVCFAAAGANTRKATLCIFLAKVPQLGQQPWETPFGRVLPESYEVLRSINTEYGDMPQCGGSGPDPIELQERGNRYIYEEFPNCDWVKSATWLQ